MVLESLTLRPQFSVRPSMCTVHLDGAIKCHLKSNEGEGDGLGQG